MRFLSVGAGALGGYFGAKLIQGGAEVEFLVRPGRAAQLAAHGVVIREGETETRTPAKGISAEQISGAYDVVLLACKAYDLDEAMDAVTPAVGSGTAILPVLNGVKHIDILTGRFGDERILAGLTLEHGALKSDGVIMRSPLSARHAVTTLGELHGPSSDRCRAIQHAMEAGGMKVVLSDAGLAAMWGKFPGFASATTIATLCRSRAGAIAASSSGGGVVDLVLAECGRVAAAEGYPMPDATVELVKMLFSDPASGYGPSMLEDLESNRRTEGEHVIGDMADRAARHAISVPLLTAARCAHQAHEINRLKM
jgi:2-dehydropantoate 2-reductase